MLTDKETIKQLGAKNQMEEEKEEKEEKEEVLLEMELYKIIRDKLEND